MKSPSQIRESYIIVAIFVIAVILLGQCSPARAAIPQGESWTVPDNARWHQVRIQMQLEHKNWLRMATMFKDYPEAAAHFQFRAWIVSWAYKGYFGVEIN